MNFNYFINFTIENCVYLHRVLVILLFDLLLFCKTVTTQIFIIKSCLTPWVLIRRWSCINGYLLALKTKKKLRFVQYLHIIMRRP